MNDAMDHAGGGVAIGKTPDFIPSSSWQGQKPGYYFGTTSGQGTGYYKDKVQQEKLNGDGDDRPRKRAKRSVQIAEDRNETKMIPSRGSSDNAALLLEQAEAEAEASDRKVLDLTPRGVRAAAAALGRAIEKNELRRAQYPDQPDQYMESEIALYESISQLKAIAADPLRLYPVILEEKTELLSTLIQLLVHENEDIVTSVISVLLEWLDSSLLEASGGDDDTTTPGGSLLVVPVAMLASTVIKDAAELLVSNLARIRGEGDNDNDEEGEDEVGKGTEDVLSIFENLLEMDMTVQETGDETVQLVEGGKAVAAKLCQDTTLVSWLFQQVEEKDDTQKSSKYRDRALEVLAILAPREDLYTALPDWNKIPMYKSNLIEDNDDEADNGKKKKKERRKSIDGIEILLQAVASYRKKQPSSDEELETLENACMIMASALTYSPLNVQAFLHGQGIELVVRCLKERVHAGGTALKWLDFAGGFSSEDGNDENVYRKACEHMVAAGSLKYLFPFLMGRALPNLAPVALSGGNAKKMKKEWKDNIETTTIRILYALTRHITDNSPNDAKQRLLAKFVDHEKCDRLVELCFKYDEKARTAEYKFYRSDAEEALRGDSGEETEAVQLAALSAKLAGGGDVLHRLAAVVAFCCVGSKRCHERILVQLQQQQQQSAGMALVREAIEEFASNLGDGAQKQQLQSYLEQI